MFYLYHKGKEHVCQLPIVGESFSFSWAFENPAINWAGLEEQTAISSHRLHPNFDSLILAYCWRCSNKLAQKYMLLTA
jgi:hypothetical protein